MKKMNKKTVIGLGVAGLTLLGGAGCIFEIGYKLGVKTMSGILMEASSRALDKFDDETDLQAIKQFVAYTCDETKNVDAAEAFEKFNTEMKKRKANK